MIEHAYLLRSYANPFDLFPLELNIGHKLKQKLELLILKNLFDLIRVILTIFHPTTNKRLIVLHRFIIQNFPNFQSWTQHKTFMKILLMVLMRLQLYLWMNCQIRNLHLLNWPVILSYHEYRPRPSRNIHDILPSKLQQLQAILVLRIVFLDHLPIFLHFKVQNIQMCYRRPLPDLFHQLLVYFFLILPLECRQMHHPHPIVLRLWILLDQGVKGKYHETDRQSVLGRNEELGCDALSQNRIKGQKRLDDRVWQFLGVHLIGRVQVILAQTDLSHCDLWRRLLLHRLKRTCRLLFLYLGLHTRHQSRRSRIL